MIDIHAHILPGLDDGAQDMENALRMAEMAVQSGVTAIIATPHCNLPGERPNFWDDGLRGALARFQTALRHAGIPVTILPGMEIFGTGEVPALLQEGKLTTLAQSRCPLIEFPFRNYGRQATQILAEVAAMGYRPVVAHPERYRFVQEYPLLLNEWVDMGCLLQVNKGSLMGRFGRTAEMLSMALVDRGFAAFVASDAHSPAMRTTWLRDVRALLCDEFSEDCAQMLLEVNPRRLLEGAEIHMEPPEWF